MSEENQLTRQLKDVDVQHSAVICEPNDLTLLPLVLFQGYISQNAFWQSQKDKRKEWIWFVFSPKRLNKNRKVNIQSSSWLRPHPFDKAPPPPHLSSGDWQVRKISALRFRQMQPSVCLSATKMSTAFLTHTRTHQPLCVVSVCVWCIVGFGGVACCSSSAPYCPNCSSSSSFSSCSSFWIFSSWDNKHNMQKMKLLWQDQMFKRQSWNDKRIKDLFIWLVRAGITHDTGVIHVEELHVIQP